MGKNLQFDWDTHSFKMGENGNPVLVDGEDALKAWVEQSIRVTKGVYEIYPDDYGMSIRELMRYRVPNGYVYSEIKRELNENAKLNDHIDYLTNIVMDGSDISYTIVQA